MANWRPPPASPATPPFTPGSIFSKPPEPPQPPPQPRLEPISPFRREQFVKPEPPPPPDEPVALPPDPVTISMHRAKARKMESEATLAEARTERFLGTMVPTDAAMMVFNNVLTKIRENMVTLGGNLAAIAIEHDDIRTARVAVDKLLHEFCQSIVSIDPSVVLGEHFPTDDAGHTSPVRNIRGVGTATRERMGGQE